MAQQSDSKKEKKRRRRQKGVLTALGIVFAASAVLRIGALDLAFAEDTAAPHAPSETHVSPSNLLPQPTTQRLPSTTEPLRHALEEVEALRVELEAREALLNDRELAIATAQALVEERLAELEAAEIRLQALISISDGAAEGDLERLTRVYETMSPDQAAPLFSEMDASFAAGFLSRMTAQSSAAIMAEMAPEDAYAISVIIATRNATAPTIAPQPNAPEIDTEN